MKSNRKLALAALFLMCLVPASFAAKPKDRGCDPKRDRRCQQVPEGGSAAIYLLGAGITCLGAMVIRSRSLQTNQS
jgi:hypothetical protein